MRVIVQRKNPMQHDTLPVSEFKFQRLVKLIHFCNKNSHPYCALSSMDSNLTQSIIY
jgi:hypothetical protein